MFAALLLLASIWAEFAPGSADNPSAVVPVDVSGKPVAIWWDEKAFHVGERAFSWKAIGVKPDNGSKFRIDLGENADREKVEIFATLRKKAPHYRVGSFGQIGNTNIVVRSEVTAKAKG